MIRYLVEVQRFDSKKVKYEQVIGNFSAFIWLDILEEVENGKCAFIHSWTTSIGYYRVSLWEVWK